MNYAVVENGIVINVIWLYYSNANEFPNAVPLNDVPAGIGDVYKNGAFYRNGERILTPIEVIQKEIKNLDSTLLETSYQNIIQALE